MICDFFPTHVDKTHTKLCHWPYLLLTPDVRRVLAGAAVDPFGDAPDIETKDRRWPLGHPIKTEGRFPKLYNSSVSPF